MNHPQSSFARSLPPRVAAEGRGLVAPPCGAPATIIHDQMYDDRRAGQLVGECSRHAPVRVLYDRGQGILPDRLGRRLRAGGSFGAEGRCVNSVLAKPCNRPLGAKRLKNFTQGSERHFIVSSLDSHDANENGLTHAQILFAPGAKTHD